MKKTLITYHLPVIAFLLAALPAWAVFTPVDPHAYPDNMTMVVQLKSGGQTVDTCEVAAFIDGECRCCSRAQDGLYYLIIPGEEGGQQVELRTCLFRRIVTIDTSVVYYGDRNVGTPWEPFVIDISDLAGRYRLKGDCNGDGAVDVADVASVVSVMSGDAGGLLADAADVNGDGHVDVADIAAVISIMSSSARKD